MTYKQSPPFCIQVEMTEGCTLSCPFCGINGIREHKGGPFKFQTIETATRIAEALADAGWNSRIEFAMHGEPSINPNRDRIIAIFRKHLPNNQLMLTSNGSGFLKGGAERVVENIRGIFDAGLNVLALDEYQNVPFVGQLREVIKPNIDLIDRELSVYEYPKDPNGNPHRRRPIANKIISFIAPIDVSTRGTHAHLNNHCGNGAPLNDAGQGKRCAKPFRELSFRWDGNVAICCNDWRGVCKIGNIHNRSLDEIWNHPVMDAARKFLIAGRREFAPCKGCDALSYRVGLLPDPSGKDTMPDPTDDDLATVREATYGDPFSPAVTRPWEERDARHSGS